ncbi:sensor histidine kinase [Nesterenkonia alkaliphila]|uniref:sensor histidine kinase n=1 Tax=Nesterenkonia alkaliphila TaxID=1463631 RepID=UPI0012F72BF4|nr:sensor histidine kinase [Nesterenkonia alkaliphila]
MSTTPPPTSVPRSGTAPNAAPDTVLGTAAHTGLGTVPNTVPSTVRGRPEQPRPQHVAGFLYAGIWVLFLAVPLVAAWFSTAETHWRIIAVAATLAFGVVYLWFAWHFFSCPEQIATRRLFLACSALGVIAALSIPGIGPWFGAFTTFIAALVIYTRPPLVGIPIGVLIWAAPTVTGYLLAAEPVFWIIGGPGIGMLFVIIFRITEYYDERDREQAESLRHAEERDRIARDVHDVLGHSLTVLTVKAQLARRLIDADQDKARAELAEIEQISRQALGEVRSTVTRLKSPHLPMELDVARDTLESAGITPVLQASEDAADSPVLAWALREAVTNVVRHSQASRCEIVLTPQLLRVADDGVGVGSSREGNGLRGLRERAKTAGAGVVVGRAYPELEGTSPERPGTQIEVRLP